MKLIHDRYLPYPVACVNCGISYTPSDNTEGKRLLKIPALYANNFCSRKCKEEYDEILERDKLTSFNKRHNS